MKFDFPVLDSFFFSLGIENKIKQIIDSGHRNVINFVVKNIEHFFLDIVMLINIDLESKTMFQKLRKGVGAIGSLEDVNKCFDTFMSKNDSVYKHTSIKNAFDILFELILIAQDRLHQTVVNKFGS